MDHMYENPEAVEQLATEDMWEQMQRREQINALYDAIYAAPLAPELTTILLKIVELAL